MDTHTRARTHSLILSNAYTAKVNIMAYADILEVLVGFGLIIIGALGVRDARSDQNLIVDMAYIAR